MYQQSSRNRRSMKGVVRRLYWIVWLKSVQNSADLEKSWFCTLEIQSSKWRIVKLSIRRPTKKIFGIIFTCSCTKIGKSDWSTSRIFDCFFRIFMISKSRKTSTVKPLDAMQIKNIERSSKNKHNKHAPRRKRMNCFRCSIIYDRIYHFLTAQGIES